MKIRPFAWFGLVCLFSLPLEAQEAPGHTDAERLQRLENAVKQLQQRNAELESEVHQLKGRSPLAPVFGPEKTPAAGNDNKAVFSAPSPPPVDVHPGGSEYKLTLGGYIQANFEDGDVSAFEGRFGATALKDRFRLRRARISLTGDFAEQFDFKIEGDLEQSDAAITALKSVDPVTGATTTVSNSSRTEFSGTDIFINYHGIPEMNVKVGQYKAPFGLEQLTPDTLIYTIERSLPTGAITPERQIGAMLWGKPLATAAPDYKDFVTYYGGIFNGNGRNFNNNDNNEFMYVARLELQPWKGHVMGQEASLKLGGDYLHSRDAAGTNISPALNLKVNPDGSLTSFTLASPDERNAFSFDAWLKIGPFDFIAEYLEEQVDGRAATGVPAIPDFTTNGFYVQGSYFILPKKLQGVLKWEALNPGQLGNDGIHSLTAGLNYYIHSDNVKLMGDYVHTWSDFRDANPQFGDAEFDEVLLRLQVIF
jgi:phosphate-selective porin